jgi:hypothetical protein
MTNYTKRKLRALDLALRGEMCVRCLGTGQRFTPAARQRFLHGRGFTIKEFDDGVPYEPCDCCRGAGKLLPEEEKAYKARFPDKHRIVQR